MSWTRDAVRVRFYDRGGFTLIETLVAFTVMAMLMSVLFRGVVQMRSGAGAFTERTIDELVARAVLDDALAKRELRAGSYFGQREGRHWSLVARPIDLTAQIASMPTPVAKAVLVSQPTPPKEAIRWAPQRLIVRVQTRGRPVEIETIRLAMVSQP